MFRGAKPFYFARKMSCSLDETYEKAEQYWSGVASDVDGMLGGFERLHQPDITASKQFLTEMKKRVGIPIVWLFLKLFQNHLPVFGTALDCGAGIGRITKHLLLPLFERYVFFNRNICCFSVSTWLMWRASSSRNLLSILGQTVPKSRTDLLKDSRHSRPG